MRSEDIEEREELISPSEVAKIFGVGAKTITRWAKAGKLSSVRTLGGHRRYYAREVAALLAESTESPKTRSY